MLAHAMVAALQSLLQLRVYEVLRHLQGSCVPYFVAAGLLPDDIAFIAIRFVSSSTRRCIWSCMPCVAVVHGSVGTLCLYLSQHRKLAAIAVAVVQSGLNAAVAMRLGLSVYRTLNVKSGAHVSALRRQGGASKQRLSAAICCI